MKRGVIAAFAALLTLLFLPASSVQSEKEQVKGGGEETEIEIDFSEWERYFEPVNALGESLGAESAEELVSAIAEGKAAEAEAVIGPITSLFLPGLKRAAGRLVGVFALAILSGLVYTAFDREDGAGKTLLLLLTVLASLGIGAELTSVSKSASDTAASLSAFTETVSPTLVLLLSASGCAASSALLAPRFALLAGGISTAMRAVILPLTVLSGTLSILNGITGLMNFDRAIKLINKTVKWLIGLMSTLFTALVVLGGAVSGAADGVSLRAARYAVDRMMPAGGAIITGTVETAGAGALIMKNAAGVGSVVLLCGVLVSPLVELACCLFAFRLTAALVEPFSDERIPRMLDRAADAVGYMFAALAACAAMFTLTAVMVMLLGSAL